MSALIEQPEIHHLPQGEIPGILWIGRTGYYVWHASGTVYLLEKFAPTEDPAHTVELIDAEQGRCDCKDFRYRGQYLEERNCRHIRAARMVQAAIEEQEQREATSSPDPA